MADCTVTVTGAVPAEDGTIFTAVNYYDGESFYSHVVEEPDVSSEDTPAATILEKPCRFTGLWRSKSGRIFVPDADGKVHAGSGSDWTKRQVSKRPLTTVWGLDDDSVYAGGSDGVVYRWDGKKWSAISRPLGDTIQCFGGASPNDLYVVGEGALFWHYDGQEWTRIPLPTKANLVGLLVLSPTDVLVSGSGGALFRGSGLKWSNVSQSGRDFYEMAHFKKSIYIAGGEQGVFTFDGKKLSNVKKSFPVYNLSANKKYLTLAGDSSATRFDGKDWLGPDYT